MVVNRGVIKEAMEAVTDFFGLVGLPIQEEKIETMSPTEEWAEVLPDEMCRVLGLNFQVYTGGANGKTFLEVTVPNGRVDSILALVATMREQVLKGGLTLKTAQQVLGSVASAIFHNRHRVHMCKLRVLFVAGDERRFKDVVRRKTFRSLLVTTLDGICKILRDTPPLRITAGGASKRLAMGYTDASLEACRTMAEEQANEAILAGLFLLGRGDGEISLNIRFAFSMIDKLPHFGIAVYEALAVLIALRRFPKRMHGQFRLTMGIDNTNVLYCLAKSLSGSLDLAAAVSLILEETPEGVVFFYTPSKLTAQQIKLSPPKNCKNPVAETK